MKRTEAQRQAICAEVVNKLGRFEWFRDVVVWEEHPVSLSPILEIKVNYVPRLSDKDIKAWASTIGFPAEQVRYTEVDGNGNPVNG